MVMKHKDFGHLSNLVDYVNGEPAALVDVNQGLKQFTVSGDLTLRIESGDSYVISGSTGNDGTYTVDTVTLVNGQTVITVLEVIPDPTVDGVGTPSTLPQANVDLTYKYDGRWWLTWWT